MTWNNMKHVWTVCTTTLTTLLITLHTKKNKKVNRREAAAKIRFVLLDDDEVKTKGKTQS